MTSIFVTVESGGCGFVARAIDGAGDERIASGTSSEHAARCAAAAALGIGIEKLTATRQGGNRWLVSLKPRKAA